MDRASQLKNRVKYFTSFSLWLYLFKKELSLKILHLYKTFFPEQNGGIPEVIKNIILGGRSLGLNGEVFTFTSSNTNYPQTYKDIIVTRARTNFELCSTPFSFSSFKKFHNMLPKFDLVHYHYPFPFGDFLALTSSHKIPSILTYHSDIIEQKFAKYLYAPLEDKFLSSVNKIICTSGNYREKSSNLNKFSEKLATVPLGLSDLTKVKHSVTVLNKWKDTLPQKFILFLGVIRQYKGINVLLEACKTANCKVVIAGGGVLLENFKRKAAKENISNVIFVGSYSESDKVALISLCTAVVLPSVSRNEAFGLTLVEGAMFSKPLISTELYTGSSLVNCDEKTGFIVPPNDSAMLTLVMEKLVNQPDIANRFGKNARKRYEALFTAEKMCKSYQKHYHELANK